LEAPLLTAETLAQLAFFASRTGDTLQTTVYLDEAEAIYRKLGHLVGITEVLRLSAHSAIWQEEFERAQPKLVEALALQQRTGERALFIYYTFGRWHYWQSEYSEAQVYFEKLLRFSRQEGNYFLAYWSLIGLGFVFLRQNEIAEAQIIFTECLQIVARMGIAIGLGYAYLVEGFAALALRQNEAKRAIRLFAAADATWKAPHSPRRALDQRDIDRDMAVLHTMVDEDVFSKVYEAGQGVTREEIVAYLLEDREERLDSR